MLSKCYTSMDEIYKTILHCVQGWGSSATPYFHTCLNDCLILLSEKEISFSVKANGNHFTYLCPIPEMNGDGNGFQFYFLFLLLNPHKILSGIFFLLLFLRQIELPALLLAFSLLISSEVVSALFKEWNKWFSISVFLIVSSNFYDISLFLRRW